MAVLYRHIRLDTNEVFYIGIGKKEKRAYERGNRRNAFWKAVVNKTDYDVEILLESDDYEFIKQKEIEFIALYGRRNLGRGSLVNLTDGGDGLLGTIAWNTGSIEKSKYFGEKDTEERKKRIKEVYGDSKVNISEESKKKISQKLKGRKVSQNKKDIIYKEGNHVTKKCIHRKSGIIFKSIADGCRYYNINYRVEKNRIRNKCECRSFDYYQDDLNIRSITFKCFDSITNKKYSSIAEACRELELNYSKVRKNYKQGKSRIKSIEYHV
jgi:hypothetical protein